MVRLWPFQLMIALLCVSMVLATAQIPLRLRNLGVWAIHTGILVLALSSAAYFGNKLEGDSVIFHSRALVLLPGMSEPGGFVIRPDAQLTVGPQGHQYVLQVVDIDPDYLVREGSVSGKTTAAIWLSVSSVQSGHRFARRLLLGLPRTDAGLPDRIRKPGAGGRTACGPRPARRNVAGEALV